MLFVLSARLFPQNAFLQRVAFTGVQGSDYVAAPDYRALVGHAGFATSYLRPAGVAAINGQQVDVLTEGEFVPAGTAVMVTRVEGARIFVRSGERRVIAAGFFILALIAAFLVALVVVLYYFPLGLWIRTMAAGVPLSIGRADPHARDRRPGRLDRRQFGARAQSRSRTSRSTSCSRTCCPAATSRTSRWR